MKPAHVVPVLRYLHESPKLFLDGFDRRSVVVVVAQDEVDGSVESKSETGQVSLNRVSLSDVTCQNEALCLGVLRPQALPEVKRGPMPLDVVAQVVAR